MKSRSTPKACFDIQIQQSAGRFKLASGRIKKAGTDILRNLGWPKAALSILLVDDRGIQKINRKFLSRGRPTDVIAFSQLEGKGPVPQMGGKPFLGDLVISLETVRRQAGEYSHSFFYEFGFCLCHGILHLMGFDDGTRKDAALMERIQAVILEEIRLRKSPGRKKTTPKRRKT